MTSERAIEYGVRAAEQALEQLAWEESVAHYERVLQVEELAVPADDARRGELTVGLAQALWRAGSYPRARQAFQQAIDIARRLGDGRTPGPGRARNGRMASVPSRRAARWPGR